MESIGRDLRFAARQLRRNPTFGIAAFLTVALGIGLTTAVFSVVNALLFRPLPGVEDPGRLLALYTDEGSGPTTSSYMDYLDLREGVAAFERLAAFRTRDVDVSSPSGTARIEGQLVTHDYFDVLGLRPAAGRFFRADEDRVPDRDAVAVLAHAYARRAFGGEEAAVGETLVLNGRAFTVVGVAPPGFRGTNLMAAPELFVPMAMQPHLMPSSGLLLDRRGWGGIYLVGRLAPGVTPAAAQAELAVMADRLAREYPSTNDGRSFEMSSFRDATMPPGVRSSIAGFGGMLVAFVALVLLVACVNVANLMLARADARRREIALRRTLGAGRGRLVRQLMTESALLAAVAGTAGVLSAAWAGGLVDATSLGFRLDYAIDARVLGFALIATLVTGLAFGLAPAVRAARPPVASGLRNAPAAPGMRRGVPAAEALVVAQVALSLAVLTAAALFGRTLVNLKLQAPGFDPRGVLTARLDPSLQGYEGERVKEFYRGVLERLVAAADVRVAAISSGLPGGFDSDATSLAIEGYRPSPERRLSIEFSFVSEAYFEALRIPIARGRGFSAADEGRGPLLVLNEAAAARVERLTGRDALLARLGVEGPGGPFMDVVGVAADVRQGAPREEPVPHMYVRWEGLSGDAAFASMSLLVRGERPPEELASVVRASVAAIDPDVPVMAIRSLDEHLADALVRERLAAGVLAVAGGFVLLLAAVGLYGVLSNAVGRRTRELGIRVALGADPGRLLRGVLSRGLGLAALGLVLGLGLAWLAGRAVSSFLYAVSPSDPATLGAVALVLLAVSAVAAWVPARRATRVDPAVTLRAE